MALLFKRKTPKEAPLVSSRHKKNVCAPYRLAMPCQQEGKTEVTGLCVLNIYPESYGGPHL